MDKDQVAEYDGKARSAPKVSEQHRFIHSDYEIVLGGTQIGPTGLLVIAELKPRDANIGTFPKFVFRWDEKANCLDVDPANVSRTEINHFKEGFGGYYGHHTVKSSSSPRVFTANIGWRTERIYEGQISFNLARKVKLETTIGLNTSVGVRSDKSNG